MFFSRPHLHTLPTSSAFPTDVFRLLDSLTAAATDTTPTSNRRGAFTPNFDVHETDSAFVLEGELPGLQNKRDVRIEFTDDNTLLVHGRIRRRSPFEGGTQPEVEEVKEDDAEKRDGGEKQVVKKGAEEREKEVKYWVAERSVGEFQRSFSFPGEVDVDAVKAGLEDGILRIVVPKKEVMKGRRIEIS